MYNLPKITEPVEELEKLVRAERDAQIQRRYHMLLLLKAGEAESRSAAARHLGACRNTIADWLDLYEEGGLKKLQEIGKPGSEPGQQSISANIREQLKKWLSEPEGFGSYKEIQQWRAEEHKPDLPHTTVHRIVRYELEAKPKAPRPSHPKKASESK